MNKHSRKSTKSQQDLNHNLLPPLFSYTSTGNLLNNSRNSRQAQSLFLQHCDCMKLYSGKADCWHSRSSVLHCRLWTGKVEKTRVPFSSGKVALGAADKEPMAQHFSSMFIPHPERQVKNVFALNSPEKAEKQSHCGRREAAPLPQFLHNGAIKVLPRKGGKLEQQASGKNTLMER